jgi:glycosyltransferase involved in cell wall biosynthesis
LKIFAITNVFGRPWDPIRGPFNQIIFDGLARRNELTLFVPVSFIEAFRNFSDFFATRRKRTDAWPYADYFIYWYIPGLSQNINAYFMFLSLLLARPRAVLFKPWDATFGSWLYPDCVVAHWVAKLRRIPSFAHAIGSDVNVSTTQAPIRKQIVKYLSGCTKVFTVSADLGRKLADIGIPKDRLEVVYNGVNGEVFNVRDRAEARLSVGLPLNKKIILFVGRISREKGCFELLTAFAKLRKDKEDLILVVAGYGALLPELKAIAKSLGILDSVIFPGPVPHSSLSNWYSSADLFCLPSYMEGIPNVVMEAMSSGIPVVATNVGGIPEVLDSLAGIMIAPRDAIKLEVGLRQALDDVWNQSKIRSHVSNYTWDATVDQMQRSLSA